MTSPVTIDVGVLELLASKICHDLISPVGAVSNGVELLEDMDGQSNEVTDLIAYSAAQASAKLQTYRMAYGAGGADDTIKPEDVHKSFQALIQADGKIKQDWNPHGDLGYGDDRPKAFSKMLMCALLLGMECLPKGGALSIRAGEKPQETRITAQGPDAHARGQTARALSLELHRDVLEPKYMHAYTTGLLAKSYGYTVSLHDTSGGDTGENSVTLILGYC